MIDNHFFLFQNAKKDLINDKLLRYRFVWMNTNKGLFKRYEYLQSKVSPSPPMYSLGEKGSGDEGQDGGWKNSHRLNVLALA